MFKSSGICLENRPRWPGRRRRRGAQPRNGMSGASSPARRQKSQPIALAMIWFAPIFCARGYESFGLGNALRPVMVVSPGRREPSGLSDRLELAPAQELVDQLRVEALGVTVLPTDCRRNVSRLDPDRAASVASTSSLVQTKTGHVGTLLSCNIPISVSAKMLRSKRARPGKNSTLPTHS